MTSAPTERTKRHRRVPDKNWSSFWRKSTPTHRAALLLLILVGAMLRMVQVGAPITYEEASAYLRFSTLSFGELLTDPHITTSHLLHALLVKASTSVFGLGLWSMRLPALLAGIAVLPVYYVVVRALFNRHIALVALALAAASGCLVELSGFARGHSLTWLCFLLALDAARHFVKRDSRGAAWRMALWCALGMWATPSMLFPVLSVFIWTGIHIAQTYDASVRDRLARLMGAFAVFLLFTVVLYLPTVLTNGFDAVLDDPLEADRTWKTFVNDQQDKAFAVWAWFTDTASLGLAIAGWVGVAYAVYISARYRAFILALAFGAVPLSLAILFVAPPHAWVYTLFVLHLSTAIALFYLLKWVQERFLPAFAERWRTGVAAGAMLALFIPLGMSIIHKRIPRYPEAALAAAWLKAYGKPNDRVLVESPWDAVFTFHAQAAGVDPAALQRGPADGRVLVLIGTAVDQTLDGLLQRSAYRQMPDSAFRKVEDWRRLEIFAAP